LDIDAHWLQRKLSKYYEEAITSQKKSIEVLEIMQKSDNQRELENQLVLLLGYDCFDFIKMLLKHRNMVLYCTLLASAQSEIEKTSIKSKMSQDPDLVKILKQLEGEGGGDEAGDGGGERGGRAAKSGGRSGEGGGAGMSEEVARCKLLSLEELAFSQGSHLMANKRCQLPDGSFRSNPIQVLILYIWHAAGERILL
jgi:pre-mRNA-splicing helicase BRR2